MRLDCIEIGHFDFTWGLDITSLKNILGTTSYVENENPYATLKTLRLKASDQWGVPLTSCVFTAPSYDRLITGFHFNVGVMDSVDDVLATLDIRFGMRSTDTLGSSYGSGSVIRNCTWTFENCRVGISIFGGERMEYDERHYGMLYFHLKDLPFLHARYAASLSDQTNALEKQMDTNTISYTAFTLQQRQWHSQEMEQKHYPGYDLDFIGLTLHSFYKRNVLKTPRSIRSLIQENQVCIFTNAVTATHYIANYWECFVLDGVEHVAWRNVLPAKGSGYCTITLGDFRIQNTPSEGVTKQLIHTLETILKRAIPYSEDYDC
jgi:hypothetical protein